MKNISIITGASSGMGSCFAKELSKEKEAFKSDEIWIIARRKDRLLNLSKEISDTIKNAPKILPVEMDLAGKEGAIAFRDLLKQKENEYNGLCIDALVNNAGFGTYGEFADTDTIREMDMIDLNCTSLTGITGFSLPYMKKGSRIIMVASLASFLPLGNFAVYGASKAYVLNFAIALGAELKHKGISVTSLCPGPVSTEFANVASKGARPKVKHGLSPEKTVKHAVKMSHKGRTYSMRFFKWKFKAFASRFVSRRLGAWATYKFAKRPSN